VSKIQQNVSQKWVKSSPKSESTNESTNELIGTAEGVLAGAAAADEVGEGGRRELASGPAVGQLEVNCGSIVGQLWVNYGSIGVLQGSGQRALVVFEVFGQWLTEAARSRSGPRHRTRSRHRPSSP
jgi:hypothetical protein